MLGLHQTTAAAPGQAQHQSTILLPFLLLPQAQAAEGSLAGALRLLARAPPSPLVGAAAGMQGAAGAGKGAVLCCAAQHYSCHGCLGRRRVRCFGACGSEHGSDRGGLLAPLWHAGGEAGTLEGAPVRVSIEGLVRDLVEACLQQHGRGAGQVRGAVASSQPAVCTRWLQPPLGGDVRAACAAARAPLPRLDAAHAPQSPYRAPPTLLRPTPPPPHAPRTLQAAALHAFNAGLQALAHGVHATASSPVAAWGLPPPELAGGAAAPDLVAPLCWQQEAVAAAAGALLQARVDAGRVEAQQQAAQQGAAAALHAHFVQWAALRSGPSHCLLLPRFLACAAPQGPGLPSPTSTSPPYPGSRAAAATPHPLSFLARSPGGFMRPAAAAARPARLSPWLPSSAPNGRADQPASSSSQQQQPALEWASSTTTTTPEQRLATIAPATSSGAPPHLHPATTPQPPQFGSMDLQQQQQGAGANGAAGAPSGLKAMAQRTLAMLNQLVGQGQGQPH